MEDSQAHQQQHQQQPVELTLRLTDPQRRSALFGPVDRYLRRIRSAFEVRISAREDHLHVSGDALGVDRARIALEDLQERLQYEPHLTDQMVEDAVSGAEAARPGGDRDRPGGLRIYGTSTPIKARTDGQNAYLEAMQTHDLTICLGPAGTGKTYLAVAMAVSELKAGRIKSIVLVRPAVEAGEKLGYLPGDMQAKVNPYLRPLFDAMHDMMPFDQVSRFLQNDVIEVSPLAFMRGRTLNNCVIILDEAQNATVSQMLMFLTRLGQKSRMIVTGDDTQVDLNPGRQSGLSDAVTRLQRTEGIAVIRLTEKDIVRHPLVQRIVDAYGHLARDVK